MSIRADVLAALGTVYDPELDEPITDAAVRRSVRRRPTAGTSTCACGCRRRSARRTSRTSWPPTHASAVRGVPGVREVGVMLEDHYTGARSTPPSGAARRFADAFPGETEGELDALRELFRRKALVARQARVCEALLEGGATPAELSAMRVADLPDEPGARRCAELRTELGIGADADAAAFVRPDGTPIAAEDLGPLAAGRAAGAASLEANGGICRSLLRRPLRRGRRRRRSQHESRPPARVPPGTEARGDRRAGDRRPARRDRADRRRRPVPDRPAHPGGPVGGEVPGRPPLHARPRERRAGCTRSARASPTSRSATRSSSTRSSPAGSAAPAGAATTCTASTALPRHRPRRRLRAAAQDHARARSSSSTRRCSPPTSPRSPTRG